MEKILKMTVRLMTNKNETTPVGGSFRDPTSRVYTMQTGKRGDISRVLRGLDREMSDTCKKLLQTSFFNQLISERRIVGTTFPDQADPAVKAVSDLGWEGVVEHEVVPFVSYPYEWS